MDKEVKELRWVLRSSDRGLREYAMGRLAANGSDAAVETLKYVADGGWRGWSFSQHDLGDQLAAVSALAETGNPNAEPYLDCLAKTSLTYEYTASGQRYDTSYHPHAKREFYEKMSFQLPYHVIDPYDTLLRFDANYPEAITVRRATERIKETATARQRAPTATSGFSSNVV